MKHAISWFDIPALDIERATKFYNAIFDVNMVPTEMGQGISSIFPYDAPMGVGGSITTSGWSTPSASAGPMIYLNANDDLAVVLDRVEAAGGKVIVPKMSIGENGFMAVLLDTEGNQIGLHSIH